MKYSKKILTILIPAIVVMFNLLIILFPKETIQASKDGISLWFNNVLPSILPFIIGANILTGLGAVNFLGVVLEPIMYPLFNVPGAGGFALAIGLTSGYPIGAKVTSEMRQRSELTRTEAQRLISFVNNSGPLFILGSVAGGMFGNLSAGYFIMLVHYLGALTVGFIFRFYKRGKKRPPMLSNKKILSRALRSMEDARIRDGRTLGAIMGQSVANAMETALQVGGFIILFCVATKALEIIGFFDVMQILFSPLFTWLHIPKSVFNGIFTGIIEMTNGAKILSAGGGTKASYIAAAAIISWGGFSIHAQAVNFISKTDINIPVYLLSKAMHAIITALYGLIFYPFFKSSLSHAVEASTFSSNVGIRLLYSSAYFAAAILALLIIAIVILLSQTTKRRRPR